jgi:hypothetical protein
VDNTCPKVDTADTSLAAAGCVATVTPPTPFTGPVARGAAVASLTPETGNMPLPLTLIAQVQGATFLSALQWHGEHKSKIHKK